MGADTKIEWADHTFNPWIGCTAVSPACDHCYAERLAHRFGAAWGPHAERRRTSESNWRQPLAWNRKALREGRRFRVFCASLADVFDNQVPAEWREDLWALIHDTPHLDWLLLTKRPQNIWKMLPGSAPVEGRDGHSRQVWRRGWANVWLGTTVENQAEADRRIPHLLAVPAARRFLSCEPLLGPLNLQWIGDRFEAPVDSLFGRSGSRERFPDGGRGGMRWTSPGSSARIDWIIAGGESGPKARASHPDWFRSLRDQCQAAGVPFFFKQWGEWAPTGDWYADHQCSLPLRSWTGSAWTADGAAEGEWLARVGKKAAGAMLDGREWREVPA